MGSALHRMNRFMRFVPLLAIPLLLCHLSAAAGSDPKFSIRTTLGVDVTGTVESVASPDTEKDLGLIAASAQRGRWNDAESGKGFILRCAKDTYLVIRPSDMRIAKSNAGKQSVTLANGQQWEGTLIGNLCLLNDEGLKKVYDMSKVVEIKAIEPTVRVDAGQQKPEDPRPQTWSVESSAPMAKSCAVVRPLFGYEYMESYRSYVDYPLYIDKSRPAAGETGQFYLRVGADETLANLDDFKSVSLKTSNANNDIGMTVVSQSGQTTGGLLTLKYKSGDNTLRMAESPWFLTADLADQMAILVIRLGVSNIVLTKAAPGSMFREASSRN